MSLPMKLSMNKIDRLRMSSIDIADTRAFLMEKQSFHLL